MPTAADREAAVGALLDQIAEHGRDAMLAALGDGRVVLLDVRDVDEWVGASSSPQSRDFCPRKGRIPGARWLEWYGLMKPSPRGPVLNAREDILAECHTVGIAPDTPVYLYCFKGARSSNSLVALKEAGIRYVRSYFASWNEWSRDPALPIGSGPPWTAAAELRPLATAPGQGTSPP